MNLWAVQGGLDLDKKRGRAARSRKGGNEKYAKGGLLGGRVQSLRGKIWRGSSIRKQGSQRDQP